MKKIYGLFLGLMMAITLIGCSDSETDGNANSGAKGGGELQVAYNAQPPTLDPILSTAVATRDV